MHIMCSTTSELQFLKIWFLRNEVQQLYSHFIQSCARRTVGLAIWRANVPKLCQIDFLPLNRGSLCTFQLISITDQNQQGSKVGCTARSCMQAACVMRNSSHVLYTKGQVTHRPILAILSATMTYDPPFERSKPIEYSHHNQTWPSLNTQSSNELKVTVVPKHWLDERLRLSAVVSVKGGRQEFHEFKWRARTILTEFMTVKCFFCSFRCSFTAK